MARSVVIETNTVKCASLSRRAAEPSAFTSHMAGEVGLEPTSYCFGDSHFSLNYSPILVGRVGVAPTMFLVWEFYRLLPSLLGIPTHKKWVWTAIHYDTPTKHRSVFYQHAHSSSGKFRFAYVRFFRYEVSETYLWYWRWELNPQKTSASKADDFANLSTPA